MNPEPRARVALVTGGAGGLGQAICETLAGAGYSVVLTYHSHLERARARADSLPGTGHLALPLEVENPASVLELAAELKSRYGTLELLVNNAGITRPVPHDDLESLDDALIDQIFRVNWRGPFATVRALRPLLEQSGESLIVNVSSIAGRTGLGSNIAYCASKAALDSMTRSLARALAPRIRVMSVSPGFVEGEYASRMPEMASLQKERTPLGRLAEAQEVALAVLACATHLRFTTGDILAVDGGRSLG